MKKRYVISNIPTKFPWLATVLYSFLLYYFKIGAIWWGVFITLFTIYWLILFIQKWNEEKVDLNANETLDKNAKKTLAKSNFAQKLQDFINEQNERTK